MERGIGKPDEQRIFPERKRMPRGHIHPTKIIAALLCFMLALLSLGLVDGNSHAAVGLLLAKHTPTATPTPTDTPTSTPTPTNTPTPTPTNTPTPTPKPTPMPTATNAPVPTPTVIATAVPTHVNAASTAITTATPSIDQTLTVVPGVPTTTHSSNNGPPSTGQPFQTGNGFAGPFSPYITGTLVFLGIAGAFLIGLVIMRRRLSPSLPIKGNLPPSGAQPWRRVRSASLHGDTDLAGVPLYAGESLPELAPGADLTIPDVNNAAAHNANQQAPTAAFPYLAPANEHLQGLSNSAPGTGNALPDSAGSQRSPFGGPPPTSPVDTTGNLGPVTGQEKVELPPVRPIARPIRLKRQRL